MAEKYPHVNAANKYAKGVVSGKIPACKWVRLACQRQIDDLARQDDKSWPYVFDKEKGERVCRFIEMLPHIKGEWAGQLIRLEPWECFIWSTVFGWVKKNDGMRRYKEVYAEIPRKNSKSTQAAGVGLYMLAADGEPGAEVYSGATTEKQAWEVFKPAKLMAQKADGFEEFYGIEVNASNISSLGTASKFEPIVGNPGDGASPHCAIVDEYHEHKKPDLYDTMKTGQGSRRQPLQLVITTAGTDTSSPCYDLHLQVKKILSKIEGFENEELFGIIYTIDDDDDWTDFDVWRKANPNYGVSVYEDYLVERHRTALQRASQQNIIRCKHLNQWMSAGSAFFNMFKWDLCRQDDLHEDQFLGLPCWVGVDLASKVDVAAMVALFRKGGEYYLFGRYYLPESAAEGSDKSHYQTWIKEGWITRTTGNRIDIDVIEEDLRDLCRRFDVQEVPHDPWNAAQFVAHMQSEGVEMVEIPQTVNHISEPMKELDALILDGKIHHNGDPVMRWMMSNVVGKYDKKDNVFPYKERQENKIDGPVALIMALSRAIHGVVAVKSRYEDPTARVIAI